MLLSRIAPAPIISSGQCLPRCKMAEEMWQATQEDVAHLVEAQRLLSKAKEVLERYYAKVSMRPPMIALAVESHRPMLVIAL